MAITAGAGAAEPDGDDHVEHPERQDFGWERWGVREDRGHQRSGLTCCRDRIALACASLQAGCEAVRVRQSEVERGRRGGEPAGVEAGRPAGEIPPELKEPRGRAGVADGEAQVAQRAFVGVEAKDLGRRRGAHEGEALPERA